MLHQRRFRALTARRGPGSFLRRGLLGFVLLVVASVTLAAADSSLALNASSPDVALPSSSTSSSSEPETLQQYGQTFVLAGSTHTDVVHTEEYVLQGESVDNWSQLLTYQRVRLPEPFPTDEYVMLLKRCLEQRGGAPRIRIVQQGKTASLFGIHYPATDRTPEQVALALLTIADPQRPNELHLVQYAVNPARLSLEEMELQIKRWQGRLQSQAASLVR